MTHLLVLLFISTKHYQNMSKGIKVMEHTRTSTISASGEITNKLSCLSCMRYAYWSSSSSLLNMIKLSEIVWELWPAEDFGFRRNNYIMKTVRVVSLAFLPNIIKACLRVSVMEHTRMRLQYFCFRGDNYITNKVRVVSLAWDTPTGPPLHSYQILSKYICMSKGIEVMERKRMRLLTDGCHGDRYIPRTYRSGDKNEKLPN